MTDILALSKAKDSLDQPVGSLVWTKGGIDDQKVSTLQSCNCTQCKKTIGNVTLTRLPLAKSLLWIMPVLSQMAIMVY